MNSDVPLKPARNWRVIAQELAAVQDSRRVLELSKGLSAAIEPRTFNDRRYPGTHHTNGANYYQSLQNSVHTASLLRSVIEMSTANFGNVFDPANRALRIVAQSGFGEGFLSYFETVDVATDLVFGPGDSRNVLAREGAISTVDPCRQHIGQVDWHAVHALPSR